MEYNKQQFAKSADRKKLHKVKKQWVVISTALLMALGGGALATHVSAAHADNTNNQSNNLNSLSNSTNKSAAPQLSVKSSAAQSKASNGSNQSSLIMNQAKSLHSQILNAGLQKHTTSSASTVQRRSGSKSAVSSASQSTSTSSKAAQSSAKQSESGSNAVQKVVSSADKLGADANTTNNDMIVKYFNQHGKQIGYTDKIAGRKSGDSIDVTNPSQGGEVVPRGYKLDPGMIPNQTFTDKNQIINLELMGDQITSDNDSGKNKVTIHLTKNSSDGSTDQKVSDMIKGHVGDTVAIDPGNYLPKGYYANSDDHEIDVTINQDGTLSGLQPEHNTVDFGYTKDNTQLKSLNKIYMHYVDVSHQNNEVPNSTLSDADMTGTPFNSDQLKQFETLSPKGYYSLMKVLPGEKIPTSFAGHTQSITFLVSKDDDINYVDQSDGTTLKTIYLNPKQVPNGISYQQYSQPQYLPQGYSLVGAKGTWNPKFVSGGVNTILIRRSNQYGKINIDYVDESNQNKVVGQTSDTQKVGTPFNDNQFTTASDVDQYTHTNSDSQISYKYDRVLNSVSGYAQEPQTIKIGVTEVHKAPKQSSDGVATILYKDASDQQQLGQLQTIKGKIGTPMNIYYDAFSNPSAIRQNVGQDYVLAKDPNTDPNNDSSLQDEDKDTIWVKKAAKQAVKSQITVDYVYNNGLVGSSSISKESGTAFNPEQYAEAHVPDPAKYTFGKIESGSGITSFTDQPQTIIASVNLKNAPVAKGTVNIDFMYNGQQEGSHTVTSDVGHAFNINNYEKASDGMPNGYSVANVTPNIAVIPKGTETETVNLKKNVVPAAKSTVNIDFMYNNQRLGHDTVTSDVGHSFDITNYEKASDGMPDGYSIASVTPNITVFTNTPQNETVNLKKNVTPTAKGTVNIDFMYNGQQLGHDSVTSDAGRPFNVSDYEKVSDGMPSGYSVASVTPNIAVIPKGTETETVNLKKNVSPQIKQGRINVYFKDNGTIYGPHSVTGNVGDSFNIGDYENVADGMPANTHVTNVEYNVTKFDNDTQNIYVDVAPNATSDEVTDTIQFRHGDSDNSTLINTIHPKGEKGQSFDVSSQVPSQYNVHSNTKFTFDGGTHVVYVGVSRPNGNNVVPVTPVTPQGQGTINVYFNDNGNVSGPHSVTGNVGDSFNIGDYENVADGMPANTHVTGVEGNVTKFTKDTQNVYVDVAGNSNPTPKPTPQPKSTKGTINIYFNDANNTYGPYTVTGKTGDPFNIAKYENVADGMPANTHVTGVFDNTNKFPSGTQDIFVNVAGNTPVNPTPNSNTPSSSNNPSSAPASSSAPSSNNTPSSHSASSSAPSSNNTPSSSSNAPSDSTPSSSDTTPNTPSNNNGGGNSYSNHHGNQSTPSNSSNGNSLKNRIVGNNSRNTSRRLAQTGEASNYDAQIAEVLVTLGMALSALGYAIDRKRRDY